MIKKTFKIAGLVVSGVVGIFLIAVFSHNVFIQPGAIRAECDANAQKSAEKASSAYETFTGYKDKYSFYYTSCLRQHGM